MNVDAAAAKANVVKLSTRTVNLLLLAILAVEFVSGLGSFLAGAPDGRWVLWAHRVAGFALLVLLGWKLGIVVRSYRKRGLTQSTALSAILGVLFLAALAYGLLWSMLGIGGFAIPGLGLQTGLGMHVTLAFLLLPLLLQHILQRWSLVRLRRPDFASRRAALRFLVFAAAGTAGWQASERVTQAAAWPGAARRFTGSQETGSFAGNAFPTTNWLRDPTPEVDTAGWQLRIHGAVERELTLSWAELRGLERTSLSAILDCTGGWYSEQVWSGPSLATLVAAAGPAAAARSIVVHAATGYRRRYPLAEAARLLLATEVGGAPLAAGHGYPTRLVAPGRRGYDWVKWVTALELSELPAWLQSPLPLR